MAAPDDAAVGQFFRLLRKNELADAQQMTAACPGLLAATYQRDYGPLSYVCCQLSFGNPSGNDYLALATWLMQAGADPNLRANDGCLTALHYAAGAGEVPYQMPLLQLLLEHGADPAATDLDGLTPADTASQQLRKPAAARGMLADAARLRQAFLARAPQGDSPAVVALRAELEAGHAAAAAGGPTALIYEAVKWGREDFLGRPGPPGAAKRPSRFPM
jgi:hypothetical protein